MKKNFLAGFFVISFFIVGCASNSGIKDLEQALETDTIEEVKKPSVNFLDWQYKGFGQELPDWVEPAYFNSIEVVLEVLPEFANEKIVIVRCSANTLDQAEAGLNQQVEQGFVQGEEVYTLKKRIWIQIEDEFATEDNLNSNAYVALGICVLETEVSEN